MHKMKRIKTFMLLVAATLSTVMLNSCDTDDENYNTRYAVAIVTLKNAETEGGKWFMQLSDSSVIYPQNMPENKYGDKERRAYIRFNDYRPLQTNGIIREYSAEILTIDTILTKSLSPMIPDSQGNINEGNKKEYGADPVEIVNSWETCAEDGYLTLRIRTRFSHDGLHRLSLVHRTDAKEPYLLEFYHNANGDVNGVVGDALVAFRLDDVFNEPEEPYEITLKWYSFSGEKTTKFKYTPRKK